jgi:hypothetical protein
MNSDYIGARNAFKELESKTKELSELKELALEVVKPQSVPEFEANVQKLRDYLLPKENG